jgi:hypothetical protein
VPPFDGSFINPIALAELMDISVPELEARIASGEIAAVQLPDGEWAVPRKQAYMLLGIITAPPVFRTEVDGQAYEVLLHGPDE